MSMIFSYRLVPTPQPVVTLGGRRNRPWPLVTITLIGPGGTAVDRGLIDTGADDTIFREATARRLGLDLRAAPTRTLTGVGVTPYTVRYAQIRLRLTDGNEYREWPAWVGFTATPLRHPTLGFAGCLQFFDATFRGQREEVELAVNPLYPGI